MNKSYTQELLNSYGIKELRDIYRDEFNGAPNQKNKATLIEEILKMQEGDRSFQRSNRGRKPVSVREDLDKEQSDNCLGLLDLCPDGYGFLRVEGYCLSKKDIFVPKIMIRQNQLRQGDIVEGIFARIRENESPALQKVVAVNGIPMEKRKPRAYFDNLVPCYPDERYKMEIEGGKDQIAMRCIDLLCPIGKGQRGLIVAPPKTGKTTLLKKIAMSIQTNYPKVHLITLLIDERPEEVTEILDCVEGEVVYSTFDETPEHHIKVAELVNDRAKRLVEEGVDVVILLDSITKLTRAYNVTTVPSGKTLSGGLDPTAVVMPKKFFGTARNIKGGASLTIIATALVETGSRMDEVIYEEFKGTGNMEIQLSSRLSERRVFPAIDLYGSGTRREELLLSEQELDCAYRVRKLLEENPKASENFLEMFSKTKSNDDFVAKFDTWLKLM